MADITITTAGQDEGLERLIKDVNGQFAQMNETLKGLAESETKQNDIVAEAKLTWTELNQALEVGKKIYSTVNKVIDETIGEYVDYANSVRTLNQINGESAENNSILIQTLDDYKISADEAIVAQRKLATQGKDLTIPTIAKLSEEYLKLNSGAERQQFLTENFGRASAGWAEAMSQGADAILARSREVDSALILDQKAIDKAREYEMALDDLNDAETALKVTMGEEVTPKVIQIITALNQVIGINRNVTLETYKMLTPWERMAVLFSPMGFITHMKLAGEFLTQNLPRAVESTGTKIEEVATSIDDVNESVGEHARALHDAEKAALDYGKQLDQITSFAKTYRKATEDVNKAQDDLNAANAEYFALLEQGYADTSPEVLDAKNKVDEMTAALEEEKQAAADAINEMIAGFLQVQLTLDGTFTQEDMNKVLNFRLEMGLLTDEEYRAAQEALALAASIAAIPDRDVYVTTHFKETSEGTNQERLNHGKNYAQGADFIIPPGYPNDSYPIGWGTSGEGVHITPPGETPKSQNGLTVIFNGWQGSPEQVVTLLERKQAIARLIQ
jgi:hypothetical protein